ncbi:MAG TPA: hypothetical protein PKX07_10490 [Aggregatilineales bacterium]|nr:hypothetical protein [Aggregatilineales bacterium]
MTGRRADLFAVLLLIGLWALFFWRLLTPIPEDQASFTQGDFSGQFVAFGGYQYARMSQGEIPLWNPYNNGGLPFIADTQAAVFYPPRLLTIALSAAAGGWTYHALELEAIAHVLAYTLLMYAFVRRLTRTHPASVFGALVAAVTAGYGGYISGYPPLQLTLLEAGIWLPLAALGIHEATRLTERVRYSWLLLTGFALGLSWLAGHPQTSYFLTFFLVAYFAYQIVRQRRPWRDLIAGTALFGVVSVGVVAVTLLPGLEYLMRTSRSGLGFDAKGGGFPFQDIAQMIFPGVVSLWSPLYFGVIGLPLALAARGGERGAPLPHYRVPGHHGDRRRDRPVWRVAPAPHRRRQLAADGGPALLRDGPRLRLHRGPAGHRRPIGGRLGVPGRDHGGHHVRPLRGQCGRRGRVRRCRQRPSHRRDRPRQPVAGTALRRRARPRHPRDVRRHRDHRGRAGAGHPADAQADHRTGGSTADLRP